MLDWTQVAEEDLPDEIREIGRAVAGAKTTVEVVRRLLEGWAGTLCTSPNASI